MSHRSPPSLYLTLAFLPFLAAASPATAAEPCCAPLPCSTCCWTPVEPGTEPPAVWLSAEYLLWWSKSASVVPLASVNNDPGSIAALNEPGTQPLIGGGEDPLDFGLLSGLRTTAGCWLIPELIALEGSLFWLEQAGTDRTFSAPGGQGPVLAIPFRSTVAFAGNPIGETSLNPGNVPSAVRMNADSRLWGADATALVNLWSLERFHLLALTGFRYLDLDETLSLTDTFYDAGTSGTLSTRDDFATRNQFFGGILGLRTGVSLGRLALDLTGRVALGGTEQQSWVSGSTTVTGGAFGQTTGATPAGVFAQPSNTGQFSRNVFAVVPEAQARLSFTPVRPVRVWVAYDFLYLSDVVRAGTQIDRAVNPTQNTVFLTPEGPPAPVPTFQRTDYWTQGISFGLQVRY